MRIEDIAGKRVRLSPHSITCIDENGKTCGVVRNLRKTDELPKGCNMALFQITAKHGFWHDRSFKLDQVYCIMTGVSQFSLFYIMLDPTLYPLAEERERYSALLEQLNAQSDIKVILVNELRKGK